MSSVPPPRGERALIIAAGVSLLVAIAFLHREVLWQGLVYHMDDAADGYYPSHVAILRAFAHGQLPTWERGAWCGWPLSADPYYGAFYPLTLLFALFGAVRGLGFTIALHMLLSSAGTFWLLRRRKLDLGPALLGAAAIGFSSFMVCRIRHIIFAELFAWLPFVFVGVDGWLTTRRVRELILAAGATGLALLCGALPLAPYVAIVGAAYVLPRLVRAQGGRRGAFVGLAVAALSGGLLAAAQIVPTVAHMPYSPRALGADYAFASSYAWPNLGYAGTLLVPDVYGSEDRAQWFGAFNHWEMAGYYSGALVVLLAPLGLLRARRRPELWALFGTALLGVGLAFGDHGPFHAFFFKHVPLYAALRCPTRALVMGLVALPILAAEGLTWLLSQESRPARTTVGVVAGILLAAGVVAAYLLTHGKDVYPPNVAAARQAFAHLSVVVAAGSLALLVFALDPQQRRVAGMALALVALADLVQVDRGYLQPKPADWATGTERFAAVDWLLAKQPIDRFVTDAQGPFRLHNVGMTYGLESAGGYDSVSVWRLVHYLWIVNHGAPYPFSSLKDDLAAGVIKNFHTPLVDLLNVRWAIGPAPPSPAWVERYRPPPGQKPHARHEPGWDPRLNVYENPRFLPRAFVVYGARVEPTDAAQARALVGLDPRKQVILDRAPLPAPVGDGRDLTPATVVRTWRHSLEIEVTPTAPGILVVSEADYPGWSVTVDGQPAPLLRADYALRGVALGAGRHVVEMRFVSRPTQLGLGLSGVGLLGLVGLGLYGRRGRRRSSVLSSGDGPPLHIAGADGPMDRRGQGQAAG
jgi:hypothetical protein